MPANQDAPRSAPIGAIVLLVLACLLYLLVIGNIYDSHHSDAAGRGLSEAFAAIFGFALWVVLGALLAIGATKGKMPQWAMIGAVILLPLSGVAVFVAMNLTKDHPGWPALVPAILPLLIALYAMWARLPILHRTFPETITSAVFGSAILVLTIVPLAVAYRDSLPDPVRDARIEEAERAREEQSARELAEQRQREAAKFAALNPDSSLSDYLEYLLPGDNRFREAVEGVRRVKSRDSDAVALLNEGRFYRLQEMWRFGINATPALCAAYGKALTGEALKVDKTKSTNYLGVALDLERQFPNIKWLINEHCDLNDVLDVLAKNIQAVSDSSRLDKTAADFAALRQPR